MTEYFLRQQFLLYIAEKIITFKEN